MPDTHHQQRNRRAGPYRLEKGTARLVCGPGYVTIWITGAEVALVKQLLPL
jgi:hypothetical protein